MPSNIVTSFAKKTGKSEKEVDDLWNKAKEIAKEAGHEEDYDYITGILKKMLKINEGFSFINMLTEYKLANQNGLFVSGDTLDIKIEKADFTDLTRIEFSGDKTLTKLKSANSIKSGRSEDEWNDIDKAWANIAKSKSSDIEKLVRKFEKDLDSIISSMGKEVSKI